MNEWLDTGLPAWLWLVIGFALAAIEILVPSFFMLWLGVSAIVVGILCLFIPMSFAAELFIWVTLSLVCLVGWFRWVSPRMKTNSLSGMAMESTLGQQGTVLEYNTATERGVLRFSAPVLGEAEWRFIHAGELRPGDRVTVTDFSGNDLIVKQQQ
ncbi:NfeD family protein [Gilvimarinus chinensis]|uniref:NfeD family protein n=1 Tax=Gilvimarinus chinensis TaxID=396005 RepID=UPI0003681EDE|nr:NfeD family protein [Gilvimarinus chinensis]